jgi:cell division septum initiation protein DivIVA
MQEWILDLDKIIDKVTLLKEENAQLNKRIEELENINMQLKVAAETLSTKTNTIILEQQIGKNQSKDSLVNDITNDNENRLGNLTRNEVIKRLNEIEFEINDCLKILENKS